MSRKKKKSPAPIPKAKTKSSTMLGIILASVVLIAGTAAYTLTQNTFSKGQVRIGDSILHVELAKTEKEYTRGLMYRTELAADHGMLFILDKTQVSCMWMKNTKIPLAVAFADEKGEILNIEKMAPDTEDNHCSTAPAKYALETNPDWFAKNKVGTGMTLTYTEATQ